MLASRQLRPVFPIAIQRYFDVALYLLVLTGVGTLASTGTLGTPMVLILGSVLIFRGYLLAEKRTLIIPERWTSFLTVAYVVFYIADFFLISHGFIGATVHLVLFVMVVRLFSAKRDRDQYLLVVISFLMVLAAAVLTVDSAFLMTFTAFICMAIITFILIEMKQAAAGAQFQSSNLKDVMAHRRMAFSIVRMVPVLVLLIALGGTAIFFLLPRISTGYLGNFSEGTDLTTGFSDRVELGSIGRIQQSNALVMHVAIDGDKAGAFDLKWRGISLNVFDGLAWTDSHPKRLIALQPWGRFVLRDPPDAIAGHPIHYRVLTEPLGSNVFFLAPRAETFQGSYRLVSEDDGEAVFDEDSERPINQYEATSDISIPAASLLRTASGSYPTEILLGYTQVPSVDSRIPRLAQQITAQKINNYDRALVIESYLRTHFGYTLQLSRTRPADPLAEFLFVRKQGHCEYFASSMAIMLRTLGIPSRVVNGFRTGEFNDLTSQYLVRERDAHSWVEAYFPGYGWITFDPTPAGAIEPRGGWNRAMLYMDAMASFWREWIVSYDAGHQSSLGRIATRSSQRWYEQIRKWAVSKYEFMLAAATRTQGDVAGRPFFWGFLGLFATLALATLANARRLLAYFRRAQLARNSAQEPRDAAGIWYERMTHRLARRGWRKLPAQTPAEFIASIDAPAVKEKVAKFTIFYESARFGGSAEHAGSLPDLYEEISQDGERNKTTDKLASEAPDYADANK